LLLFVYNAHDEFAQQETNMVYGAVLQRLLLAPKNGDRVSEADHLFACIDNRSFGFCLEEKNDGKV
jgi:hypothetical protein